MAVPVTRSLTGKHVVLTRPVGQAATWARRVREYGGVPVSLPGLSLHGVVDETAARVALLQALTADIVLFTSPAAVQYAARLAPLTTAARVCAVGSATARALQRCHLADIAVPARQDSEGVLALPDMQALTDKSVALIGAAGGRGMLREALARRAVHFAEVHVYRRGPARLTSRHGNAARALDADDIVLVSSAESLANLQAVLPGDAWQRLVRCRLVVSSTRLYALASATGFGRIAVAEGPGSTAMLAAALHERTC